MNTINTLFYISIVSIPLLIIIIVRTFNGLIIRNNAVENAFGGIDVQLKKRYDLIPNLVEIVKQYAKHEHSTLAKLTELRNQAQAPNLSFDDKVSINNDIGENTRKLMISLENYPDLKANKNFLHLQKTLMEVESQISASRRAFNAAITEYNNGIQTFPRNLFASMLNMTKKNVYTIAQNERENIDVKKMFD